MRIAHVLVALLALLLPGCAAAPAAPRSPAIAQAPAAPPAGARFDYQIGGAYAPAAGVRIVDRDRSDRAALGVYSVCYLNAFQTQADEAGFWRSRSRLLLHDRAGHVVGDPDWPGEHVLDIRTAGSRAALLAIEGPWIDGCARHGFRAVEPDNLDTFTRFGRDGLTEADALAFVGLLAARAHADGLAIAQKNTPELGARGRRAHLDFAIAEECQVYAECDAYTAVYGRHVVEVEYTDQGAGPFRRACAARGRTVSVLWRDRDVLPRGRPGYVAAWCP